MRGRRHALAVSATGIVTSPWTGMAALVLLLALIPSLTGSLGMTLTEQILVFAVLGLSVDVLDGYAGLPSLGQAAFLGTAGYTMGLLITKAGIGNFWIVTVLAIACATAMAALFGVLALRTAWIYFLLVTFAFGQLLATAGSEFSWLQTPGVEGLTGITFVTVPPGVTWDASATYWAVACMALIAIGAVYLVARSPFGYALRAMRDARHRMEVLGYNSWLLAYSAFIFAGALAGMAGAMRAYSNGIVVPDDFGITTSAEGLLVMLIGGTRRVSGAVIGATVVVLTQHYGSSALPQRWPILLGALFVVAAFWTRSGVAGLLASAFWRATGRRGGGSARGSAGEGGELRASREVVG